ncbi:bifunctional sugar-1-phosphate nucleotidylyltransferase/acetyltransferase [Halococcus thailandensis]|uniref:Bifunctional protein GlmU n=1 Tax=Halococcus thailandensis JCM 13552 TaxID=1227457 RepID=M0N8N9_9EURY|nr:bifunctional sugar-1-phosphate nucleotidylyltransferase/acetyltransferase [Halococcus thailandensis]EMA53943.1 nucleotidyl transferase [Halococcus thailandensis JCM 13552]
MQTVLLAAGEGTRMRPLTAHTPKPMLPVADRPLCAHTADAAIAAGTDELILVVGYEADAVREYFGEEYRGVPVKYATQDQQLGTAHAVRAAYEHLDDDFAVLYGDDLYDPASIQELFENAPGITAYRAENPSNYGVLDTDGERVVGVTEKPENPDTDLVSAGACVLPGEAREWLDVEQSERGEYELTDVLDRVFAEYEVSYTELDRWMGVGRPWELLEANEWKLAALDGRVEGEVAERAELRGPVVVEEGAHIEPGVVVEGPALIRSGAHVGPNAYVRGATLLGEEVRVGNGVEIKNSVVMAGTHVPHLSYVGDSVLGREVNFGANTTVANLRHDDSPVKQTVKGERVSTGRRKYGVVVGDGTKTGVHTTLYPGVVLDAGTRTEPDETVARDR